MSEIYYNRLHNTIRDLQDIVWILKREPDAPQHLIAQLSAQVGYIKHTADRLTCQ